MCQAFSATFQPWIDDIIFTSVGVGDDGKLLKFASRSVYQNLNVPCWLSVYYTSSRRRCDSSLVVVFPLLLNVLTLVDGQTWLRMLEVHVSVCKLDCSAGRGQFSTERAVFVSYNWIVPWIIPAEFCFDRAGNRRYCNSGMSQWNIYSVWSSIECAWKVVVILMLDKL